MNYLHSIQDLSKPVWMFLASDVLGDGTASSFTMKRLEKEEMAAASELRMVHRGFNTP